MGPTRIRFIAAYTGCLITPTATHMLGQLAYFMIDRAMIAARAIFRLALNASEANQMEPPLS